MGYNLFLDDERNPNHFLNDVRTWEVVRNYNAFVKIITEKGLPDFISFDHDLHDEHYGKPVDYTKFKHKTGYHCAVWLIEYCMRTNQCLPEWQVHSLNPIGKLNINSILYHFKNREKDQ